MRMALIDLEKKITEIGFVLLRLKNEASLKTRELGKGHLLTKRILQEIA